MKKWQDMADLPQDFRESTNKLERNFTVSAVIFKKYVPIFKTIFKAPSEEPPRVHRSRKQRWAGRPVPALAPGFCFPAFTALSHFSPDAIPAP